MVAYQRRRSDVVRQTLNSNPRNAVIVASLLDIEGDSLSLFRSFADNHPVIQVFRDRAGLRNYLGSEADRITRLTQNGVVRLRQCANFDFFNLTETTINSQEDEDLDAEPRPLRIRKARWPFLTLKRVEHDFLKLLRNIIGDHSRGPSHRSAYPLSLIPVEELTYTHCVRLSVFELLAGALDLEAAQIGANALEVMVDEPERTSDNELAHAFAIARRATILPVGITVDTSTHITSTSTAFRLAETASRLGPEFVTVGLNLSTEGLKRLMARKGRSRVVGVQVWSDKPPDGWLDKVCYATFERARTLGCDIVRLVMPATTTEDCFSLHTFRQAIEKRHPHPKLSTYCSGPRGRSSTCFNKVLQPVRPPSRPRMRETDGEGDTGTELPTASSLIQARYATFVHEPMRFVIYGALVSYSLSPTMHNAAYEACGMPHVYETCSSQDLVELERRIKSHTFGGAAITQPFKASVIPIIDALSPHATAIGAVNTIIPVRELDTPSGAIPDKLSIISHRNRRGPVRALWGDNSDWIGIRACLRRGLSPANAVRPQSTALVCGAGGMARAAIYAMISLGAKNVFIYNRTIGNAHALAEHYNHLLSAQSTLAGVEPGNARVRVIESLEDAWPQGFVAPTMIVVSIPALATNGSAPPNFTIPKPWLLSRTGGVVVELAYRPAVTPVVLQIREEAARGWVLMDGFDMLPEQAFAQFELFTGCRAPRGVMRKEAEERYMRDLENV